MKLQKLLLIPIVCFALLANAQAVVPPPDGGYPGFNTAEGTNALKNLSTGVANAAVGWYSLFSNTDGSFNTAVGAGTLLFNVGNQDTGHGLENTAIGTAALLFNSTGASNTAVGVAALLNNTTGDDNTGNGANALEDNTFGDRNTATGARALRSNTEGGGNTANGVGALLNNTTGNSNIALGFGAGINVTTGDFNIYIGHEGVADESNTIRIGNSYTRTFIDGIRGVTTGNADAINVVIDSNGQLGTMSSSRRFKKKIKPMDNASKALLGLKPVTFHYKSDATGTPQFGLIAEEVAEVNPDLVVRDEKGEIYTVRYDQVNAMLLNEFLKEHHKVQAQQSKIEEQESSIARLKSELETLSAQQQKEMQLLSQQLKHQAAQIQRVAADLEMRSSALGSQVVMDRP